jgi:hypothetical protein
MGSCWRSGGIEVVAYSHCNIGNVGEKSRTDEWNHVYLFVAGVVSLVAAEFVRLSSSW